MKKNLLIKLMTATLAASAALTPMSVLAAPKTMPDGGVFDPQYYASTYPDVVKALGADENVLYQHYLTYGKKEGRQPYAPALTDEQVTEKLLALKSKYPDGMVWDDDTYYDRPGRNGRTARFYACGAFAMQITDEVYGPLTPTTQVHPTSTADLRPGDILHIWNNTHDFVVVSVDDQYLYMACGNAAGLVRWDKWLRSRWTSFDGTYITRRVTATAPLPASK